MTLEQFITSEFHRISDVAKFAGLGRNSVYTAHTKGELKGVRYGKSIRIRTKDALEWLGFSQYEIAQICERQFVAGMKK